MVRDALVVHPAMLDLMTSLLVDIRALPSPSQLQVSIAASIAWSITSACQNVMRSHWQNDER